MPGESRLTTSQVDKLPRESKMKNPPYSATVIYLLPPTSWHLSSVSLFIAHFGQRSPERNVPSALLWKPHVEDKT